MNTNGNIALLSILANLAGCAASVDSVERQQPQLAEVGSSHQPTNAAVQPVQPYAPASVELTLAATDESGVAIDVRPCRMLARNPGDFTGGRIADSRSPGCGDTEHGVTRLDVDSRSEIVFTVGTLRVPGYPTYTTQATTGADGVDVSSMPLRLLSGEHIQASYAAAGLDSTEHTQPVVVQTDVDDGVYELLVNTTDPGPAPIYLDAKGSAVPQATSSFAGGWAVFPNVAPGMHTISFGHPTEHLERAPAMGWASANRGSTDVWVFPGYASLVAAIR